MSGADTSQGEGWWQASDGKWYPPESASLPPPPAPPAAPPPPPPDAGGGGDGSGPKPPFWRPRWVLITAGIVIVIVLVIISASTISGDSETNLGTQLGWTASRNVTTGPFDQARGG